MADIKDTVSGASSQVQDIAMIQMMLKVIKDAKGVPYMKSNYTGTWNDDTKDAIVRFQKDNKLVELPPEAGKDVKAAAPAKDAAPPASKQDFDKAGVVAAGSATFKKLNNLLPADYKDAMILPGGTTVYFPGDAKVAKDVSTGLRAELQLDMKFRLKAADVVDTLYQQTKLIIKPPANTGTRRNFASQMNVTSQAGPGESNHQFGQAADLGFGGLRWVDGDGTIRKDTPWLNAGEETAAKKVYMTPAKQQEFWKAHHDVSFKQIGLFPTSLAGDDVHVQAYGDGSLSYSRSLAKLLNTTGAMKWEGAKHVQGKQNNYKADLGLGGKTIEFGTAKEVFGGKATLSKADVVAALNASNKDLSKLAVFKDFEAVKAAGLAAQKAGKLPGPVTGAKLTEKDITEADIDLLRKAAKADFEKADANWKAWTAVP